MSRTINHSSQNNGINQNKKDLTSVKFRVRIYMYERDEQIKAI